ncbi:MAG TPA: DUF5694 domain-containing protein [Rhizomicrobium sp.]|nr:DUF5694 domain-containing protein [Rhizomicrobium sp.]
MRNPAILLCALVLAAAPALAQGPVSVMVIGTFHWANPNRDLHNVKADDVLAPRRQAEIARIAAGLSRFHPTQIGVEWPAGLVAQRYDAYRKGTLGPSRNEVVQLGFRLAAANNAAVHGIDADGDFPFDPVAAYARAHGQDAILAGADATIMAEVRREQDMLDAGSIGALLRWINDPAREDAGNAFNRLLMKVGGGSDQPGAALFAAWQARNDLICANLLQMAHPGDRIVLIFGAGHETLLRQCVRETPGFRLVEANGYLPN